ncbi:TIGR03757 family integrating conjugative element protein [Pseudomonas aeruginosa]|uniref:TIGR03757 family integrating conjugative element protein n=1 Tax=Pseudomonas aeruginosa TaxID=287 RepID=UPI0009A957CC|nr:TIGR03757 family integrating conjugative element protein [Pseudomonas aeruginosa]EKJ8514525.1 TIGR03757 family integrating conjugative element protein [Pseudomonas aeruginosa]ELK7308620.1 TIGR03757 family integrating conjugative element protein [Pseudomonas aeruginosa]ELP0276339.1 TIGR03757 family integrating conjugative element protein [Pseudomonas aeruginosa]MBG4805742.1 TIGR03757 family integrating conjugative element protein [Pseudomonas aeruginosa]MBG5029267.1 TIGR03757 family integrat
MPLHRSLSGWRPRSLAASFLLVLLTSASQAETWVITDKAHPISATGSSRVLLLDAQEHLEEQLTAALPQDPQQAQAAFKRLLQSPEGRRLQAELVTAQQDVADAWSLGVEKIPAVVVDRQYVVYGEPDVPRALELIAKARRSR